MNKLKESINNHSFSPDRIFIQTQSEIQKRLRRQLIVNRWNKAAVGVWAALFIAIVIRLALFNANVPESVSLQSNAPTANASTVPIIVENSTQNLQPYAMVSLDINPSIYFYLDRSGNVTGFEAVNADAKRLDLESLVGKSAEDALVDAILLAKSAGFIPWTDQNPDYILVATAILDRTDLSADLFQDRLDAAILYEFSNYSWFNRQLQFILIKSNWLIKQNADQVGDTLGWYILKQIHVSGSQDYESLSEFFENDDVRAELDRQTHVYWLYQGQSEEEIEDEDDFSDFSDEDDDQDHTSDRTTNDDDRDDEDDETVSSGTDHSTVTQQEQPENDEPEIIELEDDVDHEDDFESTSFSESDEVDPSSTSDEHEEESGTD